MSTIDTQIESFIRHFAEGKGRANVLVGFADVKEIPNSASEHLPYQNAISVAIALKPSVVAHLHSGPTLEYYNEHNEIMALLDMLEEATIGFLESMGYHGTTFSQVFRHLRSNGISPADVPALKARMIAAHAGLGWVGKNGRIITKHYGPAVRLGVIFTDAPVNCCKEVFLSRCGRCIECIAMCPVGAIINTERGASLTNTNFINEKACIDACIDQSMKNFDIRAGVCGLCIYACPYTKAFLNRNGIAT